MAFYEHSEHTKDFSGKTIASWKNSKDRSRRPEVFCKKGVLRNFPKFTGKHLCQSLFFNKVAGGANENHFKIMRTTRAMLINLCIVDTPRCQIFIWVRKVFCLLQQTFACEKVRGNIMKRHKTSALKHFSLPRYYKKWTA